jgi:hypothetical protein
VTVRKQVETQNLYTGSTDSLSFPLTRDLSHILGDGRGETFLSQGFAKDAAAAYSLRALGSYNEPVVRVRREPHDTDTTINDEQNFTASQVSGGELENWVNGKLENTALGDIATARSLHSLRKIRSGYNGNALRIRRSSDNVEVDVAFDSDDKVSASSAITNVAEQGGESGSTSATTLGDFISGTDAFVHTWYNQSGATTGATQNSALRQPKIASNGTVLDHILFEGSGTVTTPAATDQYLVDTSINFDDALTLGCVSDRLDTTGSGMYPVSVSRQSAVNRFFGIQEASSSSIFITRNSTSVSHTVDNSSELKRFTIGRVGSNSETDAEVSIFGRAFGNNNGADWGNVVYISNQNSFVIGALGLANDTGGVATGTATFQGKIYETFAYQTDEKDELFKIASNVNNYYGLYNDANDLEGTEFTGSSGTYTNNSKDGFTFVGTQTQSFVGIELKQSVPVGETVYISFNCSHNAYSESTLVGLRASTVTGANASASYTLPQYGFGVASLTSTDANAKFITFQIRQDNPTCTISGFKVSRIARNGVVQTLYDQSGNGNNASQSSAVKQPFVVQNGGQCKMTNGNPAVMGARYASNAIQFLEMDTGISDPYTMFSSMYTTRSFSLLFAGNNVGSSPRLLLNTNGIHPLLNATDDFGLTSTTNTFDSVVTLFSAENGGTAVLRKNGTQIDSLARVDDEIRPMKFLFRHQNNNSNKGVFFDSFIVYGSDKTSDFTEIENNLKLANNIS